MESNDYEKWNKLFKSVWNNIVLFRLIFSFMRLYKRNECKWFSSLLRLQQYKEREYISKIVYEGNHMIKKGDLPIGGALREVVFINNALSEIKGDAIPYGVEVIKYCSDSYEEGRDIVETTSFSKLPSTIHTIKNAVVENSSNYIIPPNITSISFIECPTISKRNNRIIIPNTIKSLEFGYGWMNNNIVLDKGDIPEGVTSLIMKNYQVKNLICGVLPSTLKHMDIFCNNNNINSNDMEYSNGLFNFIPPNVESLVISSNCNITRDSNLYKCKSINKLFLSIYVFNKKNLQVNSLPKSLTELKIQGIKGIVEKNIIPNSVKKLILIFESSQVDLKQPESIPSSVTDLQLVGVPFELKKHIIIPNSVKKLTISPKYNSSYSNQNYQLISTNSIPNSVETLIFDRYSEFDQVIDQFGILPDSLTSLEFNKNYPIENITKIIQVLPPSLKSITFYIKLMKKIKKLNISPTIEINYYQKN